MNAEDQAVQRCVDALNRWIDTVLNRWMREYLNPPKLLTYDKEKYILDKLNYPDR